MRSTEEIEMNIKYLEAHEINDKRDKAREIAEKLRNLVEEMKEYDGDEFSRKECPMKDHFSYSELEGMLGLFDGYSSYECPFCGEFYDIPIAR